MTAQSTLRRGVCQERVDHPALTPSCSPTGSALRGSPRRLAPCGRPQLNALHRVASTRSSRIRREPRSKEHQANNAGIHRSPLAPARPPSPNCAGRNDSVWQASSPSPTRCPHACPTPPSRQAATQNSACRDGRTNPRTAFPGLTHARPGIGRFLGTATSNGQVMPVESTASDREQRSSQGMIVFDRFSRRHAVGCSPRGGLR